MQSHQWMRRQTQKMRNQMWRKSQPNLLDPLFGSSRSCCQRLSLRCRQGLHQECFQAGQNRFDFDGSNQQPQIRMIQSHHLFKHSFIIIINFDMLVLWRKLICLDGRFSIKLHQNVRCTIWMRLKMTLSIPKYSLFRLSMIIILK